MRAETINVALVTYDNFCNIKNLIKERCLILDKLRSGCGMDKRSPKERSKTDVGSSVPPESPSMNPEAGRLSATYASKVINVAGSQNGI